jgi:hypothetical protein
VQNKNMSLGENIRNDMRYVHVKCHEFTMHGHADIVHLFLIFRNSSNIILWIMKIWKHDKIFLV